MRHLPAFAVALVALACAAPAQASPVLEYSNGRLTPRNVAALPRAAGPETAVHGSAQLCRAPTAKAVATAAAARPNISQAISAARKRKAITSTQASSYRSAVTSARGALSHLSHYRGELSSQLTTLSSIARRNLLTGSRMPALFLQLRRNTQFWTHNPHFPQRTDIPSEPCTPRPSGSSSGAGSRIIFHGTQLIFQYYPGAGLQIQPLANFGYAGGLASHCIRQPKDCNKKALKQLLSELLAIRSRRGGFTTWEYYFTFGGGTPPWTSGISQSTALQALARASDRRALGDKSYLRVAHSALGAFRVAPPAGLAVHTDGGTHYVEYSFAPGLRVLNAFLQSVIGLYDYAHASKDKTAQALFRSGDRAARNELHRYDTGAWSLYSEGGAESSLNYHKLVTGFLSNLCTRAHGTYCTYYKRFNGYLHRAPSLSYTGRTSATASRALSLSYRTNKVACVTETVTSSGGSKVFSARLKGARGAHSLTWVPHSRGSYTLTLRALDLAKNARTVTRSITVH